MSWIKSKWIGSSRIMGQPNLFVVIDLARSIAYNFVGCTHPIHEAYGTFSLIGSIWLCGSRRFIGLDQHHWENRSRLNSFRQKTYGPLEWAYLNLVERKKWPNQLAGGYQIPLCLKWTKAKSSILCCIKSKNYMTIIITITIWFYLNYEKPSRTWGWLADLDKLLECYLIYMLFFHVR